MSLTRAFVFSSRRFQTYHLLWHGPWLLCFSFRVFKFFAFRISIELIIRFDLSHSSCLTLIFRMFMFVFVFVRFVFLKSALTAYCVSVTAIFIFFLFPSLLNKCSCDSHDVNLIAHQGRTQQVNKIHSQASASLFSR